MFSNPFTPSFGGKPDFFFGRKEILARFDEALESRGSASRTLFITGNRGCGKTALLEQLSRKAADRGWRTIDITSENALGALARNLVRHSEATKTVSPEASVNVLGFGGSFSGFSSSRTTTFEKEDIGILVLEACQEAKDGLFVSIDEVQKVDLDELSAICSAFQMASRKGHDVVFVIAGLPYAYDDIVQHEGCTYMRRSVHERLSVFTHVEAREAFSEAFERIEGLSVENDALSCLVEASFGHPYFIQLAGYRLVQLANERAKGDTYTLSASDVRECLPDVVASYELRSLAPIVNALSPAERQYLSAMAHSLNENRVALSSQVAKAVGKTVQQASPVRQKLLREGIIVSIAHGELMFNIPYLGNYLIETQRENPEPKLAQEWRF